MSQSVNLNVPWRQQASDSRRRVEVVAGGLCLACVFSDLRHGPLLIMLLVAFLKFDGASTLWVSALSFLLDALPHHRQKGWSEQRHVRALEIWSTWSSSIAFSM
jgi:hypothetical protein